MFSGLLTNTTRNLKAWHDKIEMSMKIDAYTQSIQKACLEMIGLSDLLH